MLSKLLCGEWLQEEYLDVFSREFFFCWIQEQIQWAHYVINMLYSLTVLRIGWALMGSSAPFTWDLPGRSRGPLSFSLQFRSIRVGLEFGDGKVPRVWKQDCQACHTTPRTGIAFATVWWLKPVPGPTQTWVKEFPRAWVPRAMFHWKLSLEANNQSYKGYINLMAWTGTFGFKPSLLSSPYCTHFKGVGHTELTSRSVILNPPNAVAL